MNPLLSRDYSFVKAISNQPYYHIFALPNESNGKVVSTEDLCIRKILYNPPNKRWAGFGVTGLLERDVASMGRGYRSGHNVTGGKITLLKRWIF